MILDRTIHEAMAAEFTATQQDAVLTQVLASSRGAQPRRPTPRLTLFARARLTSTRTVGGAPREVQLPGQPGPWRRLATTRRRVAAAATVAVVAGGSLVVANVGTAPHAYAATPRPLVYRESSVSLPATPLLDHLAAVAAALQEPGGGRVHYQETDAWSLYTIEAEHHATSTNSVTPARRQWWVTDTGAGKEISIVAGRRTTVTLNGQSLMYDVAQLSTDPTVLADQLAAGHPTIYGTAELIRSVVDLWQQQVPAPAVQAAVLHVLSNAPDITDEGLVTDRAGRPGHAISAESDYSGLPTRYTLILSPTTGMLLDFEETLTTSAGALNVPIPSVVSYVLWRAHANVANIGDKPTGASD